MTRRLALPAAALITAVLVFPAAQPATAGAQEVTKRTYELALLNDSTYAAYHAGATPTETRANILAAKRRVVARLNQIYNDDLGIEFDLVEDPRLDNLADLTTTACGDASPCIRPSSLAEGCASPGVLTDVNVALTQIVGADAYDVGHLLTARPVGGGVANAGVGSTLKAQGCSGNGDAEGYGYASDPVAHEIGHQLGAGHSFDAGPDGCDENREGPSAIEPGSGSSLMSYAGICGLDDLQDYADPYFSQHSIREIRAVVDDESALDTQNVQAVRLSGFGPGEVLRVTPEGGTAVSITYEDFVRLDDPATETVDESGKALLATELEEELDDGDDATDDGDPITVGDYDNETDGTKAPSGDGIVVTFDDAEEPVDGEERPDLTAAITGGTGGTAQTFVLSTGGEPAFPGGEPFETENTAPEVSVPASAVVPPLTPFTLDGEATDADGDEPVLMWEQDDLGDPESGSALASNDKLTGPLFRQFGGAGELEDATGPDPDGANVATADDGQRTFPDLAQVVAGQSNAGTGTCGAPVVFGDSQPEFLEWSQVDCWSEFLPPAAWRNRDGDPVMHFRLTARDRNPDGGGVAHGDTAVTIAQDAAPFRVTSQAAPGTAATGGALPVTWETGGTQAGSIGAGAVRILLSTDGGESFPATLAASTPNDGSETVSLPAGVRTGAARILVQPTDGIFFSVSQADLAIADAQPGGGSGGGQPGGGQPGGGGTPARPVRGKASLRVPKRLKPNRRGVVSVRVGCAAAAGASAPARCRGGLRLSAKVGRRTQRVTKRFTVAAGRTATVRLKLSKPLRRAVRRKALKATLIATVTNPGAASTRTTRTVRIARG